MADLSVTANSVIAGANAVTKNGRAGETVAAGKTVYLDSVTKKYKLADSNSVAVGANAADGIALNGAALDQPLVVQTAGDITIGATLTPGLEYLLSETPGGIQARADLGSGENVCSLGLAKSATVLTLNIKTPGVTI